MKFNKSVVSVITACMIVTSFTAVAMAASASLDGEKCTWYGGISEKKIYSKVWDREKDGRRYNVTVWVKDDNGDTDSRTGTTSGVDAAGEVKVTKTATYDHPFKANKSGYKDFSIVD